MPKSYNKNSASRVDAEMNEKQPTMNVDAPSSRFQDRQQVSNTEDATKMETPDSGFVKKKLEVGGSALRQEVASEIINAKSAGAPVMSPSTYGLKSLPFSGDTGTLLGDASGTPIMDKSAQGKTRVDKRLSDVNKDINYLASEQVAVAYQNVPPLAASEDTVGYNGTPKNIAVRSQKKSGLTSAEILFDRSLDFIEKDEFVFATGQVVKQEGVSYDDYPTKSFEYGKFETADGIELEDWHETTFSATRGNYAPNAIKVKVKRNSPTDVPYISSFEVIEDDFSCNNEDVATVNRASTNHKIDMNRAELARQTIDSDAGSPTSEHYNPLGRSVAQPTRTLAYLQDLENSTGATLFTAYKFANKAKMHYLKRTAKDGQDLVLPAIDALYGHLVGVNSRNELDRTFTADEGVFFNKAGMAAGSAALMIALFDSLRKYNTKADIVTQPRGLKMHLQTADNNLNPFRAKKEFISALNSIDVYSTIDRGYDAMSSVCITDNVRLVYPFSWRNMLKFTRTAPGARTYQSKVFTYYYAAGSGSNSYYIKCADPVLNGVAYFLDMHAVKLFEALKPKNSNENEFELTIPTVHSTTHFSLWDLILCASAPYIIYERTNTMKDILDYEMFYKYPLQGNVEIMHADPLNCVNYTMARETGIITPGVMKPSSAIRWMWPEKFSNLGTHYLLPFYFSEDSYTKTEIGSIPALLDNGSRSISTPVIRSGVRLSYTDDYWNMSAKDNMLCMDIMVRAPFFKSGETFKGVIYKYSQQAEGIPTMLKSGVNEFTYADYHRTPRQLGWFMPAMSNECCIATAKTFGSAVLNSTGTDMCSSSFRAIMYKGIFNDNETINSILDKGSVNVNRAQAFTQYWIMRRAITGTGNTGVGFDLPLSLGDGFSNGSLVTDYTKFNPYIKSKYSLDENTVEGQFTDSNRYTGTPVVSLHRILWPLIQKMPFVISPFDDATDTGTVVDPFGYAYIFNLAGFMAADYNEEDYNRQNEVQHQGYGFTVDPMVAKSPVFKDAIGTIVD